MTVCALGLSRVPHGPTSQPTHLVPAWLGQSRAPHIIQITLTCVSKVDVCAQIRINMISRWHMDGGCYILHKDDYAYLQHYTLVRKQLVEDLHILLVIMEAQIQHIIRLIDDNLPSSMKSPDTQQLQESLHQLVQHISGIKRQHRAVMYEDGDHQELQSIYQRRISSRYWKPHQTPTRTRSCPPLRNQSYTARHTLPYDYVQLRRGWLPMFEPDSDCPVVAQKALRKLQFDSHTVCPLTYPCYSLCDTAAVSVTSS